MRSAKGRPFVAQSACSACRAARGSFLVQVVNLSLSTKCRRLRGFAFFMAFPPFVGRIEHKLPCLRVFSSNLEFVDYFFFFVSPPAEIPLGATHEIVPRIGILTAPWAFDERLVILRLVFERKLDQRVCCPWKCSRARSYFPDIVVMRIEVPLARRVQTRPVHLHSMPVSGILANFSDRLDGHHRDRFPFVVEIYPVLSNIGGLDGDAVTGLHRLHLPHVSVVYGCVRLLHLPDAVAEKALGLIAPGVVACTNEPARPLPVAPFVGCHRSPPAAAPQIGG